MRVNKNIEFKEFWVDVVGYEGLYEVSSLGNIRRVTDRDNLVSASEDTNGYPKVTLIKDSERKTINIHRLVAIAFLENTENKPLVNHIDGVKSNNNLLNLEFVTHKENAEHAKRLGLLTNNRYLYICLNNPEWGIVNSHTIALNIAIELDEDINMDSCKAQIGYELASYRGFNVLKLNRDIVKDEHLDSVTEEVIDYYTLLLSN